MDDLLNANDTSPTVTWDDFRFVDRHPERLVELMVAANLRFAGGLSLDLDIATIDGRIPEWYTWFVPPVELKYVGMSRTHRATYFESGS
jgi:hypothetical protein